MDFLTRLAQRMTGELPAVQPRLPARFEPAAAGRAGTVFEGAAEAETAAPDLRQARLRGNMAEHPQPGPAAYTNAQPQNPSPAVERPPRAPITEDARPEIPVHLQESIAHPPEAQHVQYAPPVLRAAAAPTWPLPDVSIRPAPPPRPALRVEAIPARAASPTMQPPDIRPPAGGGPKAESMAGETAAPAVIVRIGRIDVRAVMPATAPSKPAVRPTAPSTSLEEYLSGRKGGSQP